MDNSVQRQYASSSICFGCGPANEQGLQINSYRTEQGLEMKFTPTEEHQAFPGMLNGGIIGTLMDCHGNWAAAIALMDEQNLEQPPCTVTASYSISLRRPTPMDTELVITAFVEEMSEDRVNIRMELKAGEKICAKGKGLFVAVKEGHPAYHRWN